MSKVKTPAEIKKMRKAGRVVAEMHDEIRRAVRPGITTLELDAIGRQVLERRGATSNFLGYHGYPAVICTSPNDVVVHGIPGAYRLEEGDVIAIDCGAVVDGWHGDAAFSMGVGEIDGDAAKLIEVADQSLRNAIAQMVPGNRLGDIGHAVQTTVEGAGYSVVEGYTGHAIGRAMHERPEVHNVGRPGKGTKLRAGDVYAVEPMVNTGLPDTYVLDDDWTVKTIDGSLSAHVEHTIAITDDGPQILTAP
jgi:methionyl aminopeptidase